MSEPHWPRAQWSDSGDEAFLPWFVFGDFDADLRIDGDKYRTRGLPAGIDAVRYKNEALAKWDGYPLAGTLGKLLWDENARLFEQAKRAGECYMLRGALRDPSELDALRDLVGTIEALCDVVIGEYDVDADTCKRDIEGLLKDLISERLVEIIK